MKYRKKPVVIEAIQFTGENTGDLFAFVAGSPKLIEDRVTKKWFLSTLEGLMEISVNDYVIKGVKGELYPCKPDIFELTYDQVTDQVNDQVNDHPWRATIEYTGRYEGWHRDHFEVYAPTAFELFSRAAAEAQNKGWPLCDFRVNVIELKKQLATSNGESMTVWVRQC